MAVVAVVTARYVSWVFTFCGIAVVTGDTRAKHLRVVDHVGRGPDHVVVAVLTNVSC